MKIIPIKEAPCSCNAYAFPHRANGGKCDAPGDDPKSCSNCEHSSSEKDPYGTGDRWYSTISCDIGYACPWGHDDD